MSILSSQDNINKFDQAEKLDGIRLTWNVLDTNTYDNQKLNSPNVCIFTPSNITNNLESSSNKPIICDNFRCSAVLNCYSAVDLENKLWRCTFCQARNTIPQDLIIRTTGDPKEVPIELSENHTVIDYYGSKDEGPSYAKKLFMFALDITQPEDNLQECINSLTNALCVLSSTYQTNIKKGLISVSLCLFGSDIKFIDLSQDNLNLSLLFKHLKTEPKVISNWSLDTFNTNLEKAKQYIKSSCFGNKEGLFVYNFNEETESQLINKLTDLSSIATHTEDRPNNCLGSAAFYSIALSEVFKQFEGNDIQTHISILTGNPCSFGQGQVCSGSFTVPIRGFKEILTSGQAPYFNHASNFIEMLTNKVINTNTLIDLYFCSENQSGLLEYINLAEATGGRTFLEDGFDDEKFAQTLIDNLTRDTNNSTLIKLSSGLKLVQNYNSIHNLDLNKTNGINKENKEESKGRKSLLNTVSAWTGYGQVKHLNNKGMFVPTKGDCSMYEFVIDKTKTYKNGDRVYIQFKSDISTKVEDAVINTTRVVTVALSLSDSISCVLQGFDVKAYQSYLLKLSANQLIRDGAITRPEQEGASKWIDRVTIKFVSYLKGLELKSDTETTSFIDRIIEPTAEFVFHLRRSMFIKPKLSTPDEVADRCLNVLNSNSDSAILEVWAKMYEITVEGCREVSLEGSNMNTNAIIVLNTGKLIVVWNGSKANKQIKDGTEDGKKLEELRDELVDEIISVENGVIAKIVYCRQGSSQGRLLLAKLNPDSTHKSDTDNDEVIYTDDVSLGVFMKHLHHMAEVYGDN